MCEDARDMANASVSVPPPVALSLPWYRQVTSDQWRAFWATFLGWVLAILGIIFGAIGISKANKVGRGKGLAIAGLICGAVGLLLGIGIFIAALQAAKEIATHNYYGS